MNDEFQDKSSSGYQVVFLESEGDAVFNPDLFETLRRIGWTFTHIKVDRSDDVENYHRDVNKALDIISKFANDPNVLLFNGISVDLFWLNEDEIEQCEKEYVPETLEYLSSSNIYNIVDTDFLSALPSIYCKPNSVEFQKCAIAQDRIENYLTTLEDLGGRVIYYSINDVLYDEATGIISLVISACLDFIERFADGFLRLYVPDEGYQAEQLDGFVRLFESYLNRVEKRTVQVDAQRTGKATLYVFRTTGEESETLKAGLGEAVNRFDQFMAMCKDEPDTAGDFVKSLGLAREDASALVAKYAKRYTRLLMDARHEREGWEAKFQFQYEERRRQIQQQFEVDASELTFGERLTFDATPTTGLGGILLPASPSVTVVGGNERAQAIANELVAGNAGRLGEGVQWSAEEKAILETIKDKIAVSSDAEALSLKADLQMAKDETAQPQARKSAVRRLKDFGERNKSTIADAAFKALVEWLPKMLG